MTTNGKIFNSFFDPFLKRVIYQKTLFILICQQEFNMSIKETIDKAIWSHSRWKIHLKNAIETGQSEFTVEQTRNHHACPFGQWLDSAAGKGLPDYKEIVQLHQAFHEEASQVLSLALAGQKHNATDKMVPGSQFTQLTAKLVNKLAEIGSS
jgi:hypothetical protein